MLERTFARRYDAHAAKNSRHRADDVVGFRATIGPGVRCRVVRSCSYQVVVFDYDAGGNGPFGR